MSELLKGKDYAEYILNCIQELQGLQETENKTDENNFRIDVLEKQIQRDVSEFKAKGDNYGYVSRHLENEIDSIKKEVERLNDRKKRVERELESLKFLISQNLQILGIDKLKTDFFTFSFRSSKSVIVDCPTTSLPEEYQRKVTTFEANKIEIKKALDEGQKIKGCELIEKKSLVIK